VTGQQVAQAAGVSRATVSYVVNGAAHQRISPATRARVLTVAERLGYAPNAAARMLRSGRSEIVLLAVQPWPLGPVMVEAIDTAVGELTALGYTPLAHFEQPEQTTALVQACQRIQPLGLIAPGDRLSTAFVRQLRGIGTKGVVAIHRQSLRHVPTVVVVQAAFGRAAMSHLAERGHRHVLAVMPSEPGLRELRDGRLEGARAVADEAGVRLTVVDSRLDQEELGATVISALSGRRPPTAVYTFNDDYAFLVLRVLHDGGFSVPADVAVIGCDDVAAAALITPALTTVRIDGTAFGQAMAQLLHASITKDKVRSLTLDPPAVVVRETA
jgi:DNA-binding LacI/PurR family transcriptional regulator